jgi:hypothetical protein
MTSDQLAAVLAQRVFGWKTAPDRYLLGDRRWTPRWRFRPVDRLVDAIELLERAAPQKCEMSQTPDGLFEVELQIGVGCGRACEKSKPWAITLAVAKALGLEVDQ